MIHPPSVIDTSLDWSELYTRFRPQPPHPKTGFWLAFAIRMLSFSIRVTKESARALLTLVAMLTTDSIGTRSWVRSAGYAQTKTIKAVATLTEVVGRANSARGASATA